MPGAALGTDSHVVVVEPETRSRLGSTVDKLYGQMAYHELLGFVSAKELHGESRTMDDKTAKVAGLKIITREIFEVQGSGKR